MPESAELAETEGKMNSSVAGRIDIRGLDKGAVLKALHDGTLPAGLGSIHAISDLALEKAQADYAELIKDGGRIDYYMGRPIKVDIDGDSIDPLFYDRDAGPGAAAAAIANLRAALLSPNKE